MTITEEIIEKLYQLMAIIMALSAPMFIILSIAIIFLLMVQFLQRIMNKKD